jgi:hypothetical protein
VEKGKIEVKQGTGGRSASSIEDNDCAHGRILPFLESLVLPVPCYALHLFQ